MANKMVFLKTEWMEFYDGRKGDKAPGRFKHVRQTGSAHEDRNFRAYGSHLYAYAPIAGGSGGINLQRLGGKPNMDRLDHVDVVLIASGPDGRGVVVVGWYEDGSVFSSLQRLGRRWYLATGNVKLAKRLDIDERWLRIEDPPRRANVWYADDRPRLVARVRRLMAGRDARKSIAVRSAAKRDVERCILVEKRAYEAVIEKYETLGFVVDSVWRAKKGWDLEATRGNVTLQIEVKGTDHAVVRAELTAREYSASQDLNSYRICIVTKALSENLTIHTFSRNFKNFWYDETGRRELFFEDRIAARVSSR